MPADLLEALKPRSVNFEFYKGETFSQNLVVRGDDDIAIDLTGATISAKMARSHVATARTIITASVVNPVTGVVNLTLANTSTLAAGRYIYSVLLTTQSLKKVKFLDGIISINLV